MSTATLPPPVAPTRFTPPRRFDNGADWLKSLGGVPLERILFDPWPGTATEADLLRRVDGDDKRLVELVNGTLVEKTLGLQEANIGARLSARLLIWSDDNDAGAVSGADSTLRMVGGNIRLPDVCFFAKSRLPNGLLPPEKVPLLAPDLTVEVLSESNTRAEIAQKLVEYFAGGTRLAWVVDPETRTVAVCHAPGEPTRTLAPSDALDGEDVLPGFALPVADLFRNVPAAREG